MKFKLILMLENCYIKKELMADDVKVKTIKRGKIAK